MDAAAVGASAFQRLLDADHALGLLEIAATHARNHFRDLVSNDDLAQNAEMITNITVTLGECVKFAEALHADFAAFDSRLRDAGGA